MDLVLVFDLKVIRDGAAARSSDPLHIGIEVHVLLSCSCLFFVTSGCFFVLFFATTD